MVKDLSVNLCGIDMVNPVVPASGTFGFGLELADSMDLNKIGGISLKGTTREARYGNESPRIAECPSGMINSVGLQNPGVDEVIAEEIKQVVEKYGLKVPFLRPDYLATDTATSDDVLRLIELD